MRESPGRPLLMMDRRLLEMRVGVCVELCKSPRRADSLASQTWSQDDGFLGISRIRDRRATWGPSWLGFRGTGRRESHLQETLTGFFQEMSGVTFPSTEVFSEVGPGHSLRVPRLTFYDAMEAATLPGDPVTTSRDTAQEEGGSRGRRAQEPGDFIWSVEGGEPCGTGTDSSQ